MTIAVQALAPSLHADKLDGLIGDEGVEGSDGVAAAADAGHDVVGQLALGIDELGPGLLADDGLEVPHQHGVGVRADGAADEVVGGLHVGDPIADGLVDGVLQGTGARLDGDDLGFQEAHAVNVEGLAAHVLGAHVHDAFQPHHGAGGG